MKKISLLFLLSLGVWTFQACDTKKNDTTEQAEEANDEKEDQGAISSEDDAEFAVKAASGGLMEVELARMAQQKAQNKAVKDFAAMMIKDHTKANDELKSLAAQKNITLPSAPGNKHQKHIDDLAKVTGAEFDKEYMDLMVEDHEEDVKLFEEIARDDAEDAAIKAFAAKTVPTLKNHLAEAKRIKDSMN